MTCVIVTLKNFEYFLFQDVSVFLHAVVICEKLVFKLILYEAHEPHHSPEQQFRVSFDIRFLNILPIYSKTCLIRRMMVLKNLAGLSNIRFGEHCCKLILAFNAVGLDCLFLQYFQFFWIIDLLDRDYGANIDHAASQQVADYIMARTVLMQGTMDKY